MCKTVANVSPRTDQAESLALAARIRRDYWNAGVWLRSSLVAMARADVAYAAALRRIYGVPLPR